MKVSKEEKQRLEEAAEQARQAADSAHQAAADANGEDDALNSAADELEDKAAEAEREASEAVVDETSAPKGDEEEEDDDTDIDFEAEEKALREQQPPKRQPPQTRDELEKAKRSLHFNAKRVRELGGDPNEILAPNDKEERVPQDTSNFVTKDDLALEEARKLGRTDAEVSVVLHHYRNTIQRTGDVRRDIENAYMIAHKGRIQRSFDEIRRGQSARPAPGTPPGRKPRIDAQQAPALSQQEQQVLTNRGFTKKPDGSWESKRYKLFYSRAEKRWIQERKQQ